MEMTKLVLTFGSSQQGNIRRAPGPWKSAAAINHLSHFSNIF